MAAIAEIAAGSPDDQVLTIARNQGRILLTFDLDMGELIFKGRQPAPAGIVLIREVPRGLGATVALVLGVLQRSDPVFDLHLTVVTSDRVRQRPLPAGG